MLCMNLTRRFNLECLNCAVDILVFDVLTLVVSVVDNLINDVLLF